MQTYADLTDMDRGKGERGDLVISGSAPGPGGPILRFKRERAWLRLKERELGPAHLLCRCSSFPFLE
jgi:hypothetical protein